MSDALPESKATPEVAFCFLLNQLLDRERWAQERLARFAGQCAELQSPLPFLPPLRFSIAADGRVEPGGAEPVAIVRLNGIEGASALAEELRYLARHLRPDLEEELSKIFGDVAAQRIGTAVRGLWQWQADAALRVGEALRDYVTDERRLLVRRVELQGFAQGVRAVGEALERLEKRIDDLD